MKTSKIFFQRKSILAAVLALCILASLFAAVSVSLADNPIIQTIYTADPAPLVYNGRVYLYTGHDEDGSTYFTMNEWRVFSSADMVNWTDHGSPLRYSTFSWATGDAWAGQAIYRNGKFYWYVPIKHTNGSTAIGVAVSTSPTGPFTDARGTPLVGPAYGYIDPTVFIDDDGQAYLYWGNPNLWYVRLNADMISYSGSVTQIPLTTAGFGTRSGNPDRATLYEEGPWVYKRNGTYYMVFAADCCTNGEYIAYSTSSSPTGPWTYRGVIMPKQGSSFTNHAGITDFNGNSYFFYHNGALPGGGGFTRSVAVEKFTYNTNGTFPTISMSTTGAPQVGTVNPYVTNEAETIAWESGVETEVSSEGGMNVGFIDNGDYIKVKGVNFGSGAASFEARVASATSGGNIELRLDSSTGTLVGTCSVQGTGGWQTWVTRTCTVSGATGTHDLYLKFTGGSGSLFNLNWWKFNPTGGVTATPTRTPTIGASNTPTTGPTLTPTRTNTPGSGPTNTASPTLNASPTRTSTPSAATATPTSGSGGTCSPVSSTITAPFSYDGAGTFCWQSTNLGSYINSWNTNSVTLNGVNVTNLYVASGSYPAKIGGYWYVAYNSSVAWGHFEAK
nr:GH43 CBM6 [uncultured bacterium]